MSLSEMQACLARIYVDDEFFRKFVNNPSDVLDHYGLSFQERDAISGIDVKRLTNFRGTLFNKRMSRLRRGYPCCFKANGTILQNLAARYFQLFLPRAHGIGYDDVIDFGYFLESALNRSSPEEHFLLNLCRFERTYREVSLLDYNATTENEFKDSAPVVISDNVKLVDFSYDIVSLHTEIEARGSLVRVPTQEHSFLIYRRPSSNGDIVLTRVNKSTWILLHLCNGRRRLHDLVEEAKLNIGPSLTTESVRSALHHLAAIGVIADASRAGIKTSFRSTIDSESEN